MKKKIWMCPHILTIVFIALKVLGVVTWPWWQVLLPTLIPLGLGLGMLAIMVIVPGLIVMWVFFLRNDKNVSKGKMA